MHLLIDAGNSRLKWAHAEGGRLLRVGALDYRSCGDAAFADLFEGPGGRPGGAWVANVAGAMVERRLREAGAGLATGDWHFQSSRPQALGVSNGYREPAQLGVDRWIALLAAYHRVGGAVCVVDAGTACTVDAVNDQGQHLGGVIVPGTALMQASLRADTSDIDARAGRGGGWLGGLFARNTADAVAAGSAYALATLAERACRELSRSCGATAQLMLTGGDAGHIASLCQIPVTLAPNLVLEGLNLIAEAES